MTGEGHQKGPVNGKVNSMATCVHHWKQEIGDIRAPFVCKRCGEAKVMETDFYKLYESHYGKPFERNETGLPKQRGVAA